MADVVTTRGSVTAPWGAWTGRSVELPLPADWQVVELRMCDAPALEPADIDSALAAPIGAPPLELLAKTGQRAVIAIDDVTRPTRTAPLVARLVDRLKASGMSPDAITILIATGAHRPATAPDIQLKLGEVAGSIRVISHDPADVIETGVALGGQPVRVNREFLAADLRIGVGGVMPHPFAAYSGGGKIVLPGLSDLDSVVRSHKYALMGFAGGPSLEGNRFRRDMERAVREIGLHWTVNVVLNSRCETAALIAGDLVDAHRLAAARAREVGSTAPPPIPLDALILNAYPKDSELLQVEAALVAIRGGMTQWLAPGAPIVLLAACPDGLGSHRLFGPGGRLFRKPARKSYLDDHTLIVVSPATRADADRAAFWEGYRYFEGWDLCVASLVRTLGPSPAVGYASSGPLHVPLRVDEMGLPESVGSDRTVRSDR